MTGLTHFGPDPDRERSAKGPPFAFWPILMVLDAHFQEDIIKILQITKGRPFGKCSLFQILRTQIRSATFQGFARDLLQDPVGFCT